MALHTAPTPRSIDRLRCGLHWLTAAAGGLFVTLLLMGFLAARVRSAEAAVAVAEPASTPASCDDAFVATGVERLFAATVVGHRVSARAPFEVIAGATLVALEGGADFDGRHSEELAAISASDGALAFSWTRRFRDHYACGELVESWQQASQLYVVRAPGCAQETLVVTPGWRRARVELDCPGRRPTRRALWL